MKPSAGSGCWPDMDILYANPFWIQSIPVSLILLAVVIKFFPSHLLSMSTLFTKLSRIRYRHPLVHLFIQKQTINEHVKPRWQRIKTYIAYAMLLILTQLSLSQPYQYGEKLPTPPEYRDIVFLVDTSVSMMLRDYLVDGRRTDRITMLKGVLSYFIDNLHGNRIELIAFSEQPYTYVPLTNDYALLNYQLQRLQPAVLTGRTSNPSKAMLYAAQRHQNEQTTEKPVFVLLTDITRPDRAIDPRAAASHIASLGYRLHCIAIGAGSYAAEDSRFGSLVYHPTNFQLLETMAKNGQGKFYWASNTSVLGETLQLIQNTETRAVLDEPEYIIIPLYHWPLLMVLIHIFIWQLTGFFRRAH